MNTSEAEGNTAWSCEDDEGAQGGEEGEVTQARSFGRGKHARTKEMGKRIQWAVHVQQHLEDMRNGALMGRNACSATCAHQACNEMVDMRVAKLCAEESFGEA